MAGIFKNEKGSIKPAESFLVSTFSERKNQLVEDDESQGKYKCCACGHRYTNLEKNFPYSQSVFFKGNSNRLPICNSCIDKFTEQYTELLGSQDEAIKRMSLHWDMYISESLLFSSKKIDAHRSRIKNYIKNCNLTQNAGKTFDTYLKEQESDAINSYEDLQDVKENGNEDISERTVKRWGLGYSPAEYQMLNDHYKMLKEQINPDDPIQDAYIKDACEQHILKYRYRDTDIDKYDKVSKLYQATLANANLKPKDNTKELISNNPDECWGNFEKIIETMSPADYFSDKKIFEDYDHMDEYYKRFIERPTDNLRNGTNIMDEEFSIKVNNDDE